MMQRNLSLYLLILLVLYSSTPFLLLPSFIISVSCDDQLHQVYIVYFGEHSSSGDKKKTHQEIEDTHHSYLLSVKNTQEEARASLLYSYKHSINGFAAVLTPHEAAILSEMDEVVSAFPSHPNKWTLQTTRSWKFVGLDEQQLGLGNGYRRDRRGGLLHKAKFGEDIVVGLLDSGIWPESRSFNDEGIRPIPKTWKGICQAGDSFNSSHCNRKLVGARYYLKAYEHYNGPLNISDDYRSPRDHDGHGTHTSSTLGGRSVQNVSTFSGLARGTASGGAPLTRLAMYKVCWPQKGSTLSVGDTCLEADMLAAIDDAIADGVHVLSISIGTSESVKYSEDGIAIGALHAVKNNIIVSCSGGNDGPKPSTVSNLAPWIITVGASSIDRLFISPILLGNGIKIQGQTVTPYKLNNEMYPLVYAGDVVEPHVPKNSTAGQCLPGSLSPNKTKGRVVLCFRGEGLRVKKGEEVRRAGGVGIILGNSPANGDEISVDAYVLPGTAVVANDATTIFNYIKSTNKPTAKISPAMTILDTKPAPFMAAFSSPGPNSLEPSIIKPDITAPGLNILAAWSEGSSPTKQDFDHRRVKYNIQSGTSMACPHVAAAAALIKAVHPTWSSAAIRSALMTTGRVLSYTTRRYLLMAASLRNNLGKLLTTASGKLANPFNYGSGHLQPTKAEDPGLVYDASYTDYLLYLCSAGFKNIDPTFKCPKLPPSASNLNHPSLAISKLNGTVTVKRTVTNVGDSKSVYVATVESPKRVSVKVHPRILSYSHLNEKKSFRITVKVRKGKGAIKGGEYSFGWYTWSDGVHVVKSPIAVSLA